MSNWVMVDVESDGPCPGLYSMVSLGAVIVEPGLERTFYAEFRTLPDADWIPEALAVSGHTREETLQFPTANHGILNFKNWLGTEIEGRPWFISDNNGFDWQFVNWYCWRFLGGNPFGHSSTNLGSVYKGIQGTTRKNFKHLRRTKHTHHPVDDAVGNAEAMLAISEKYGMVW